jgi:hypothetical protein
MEKKIEYAFQIGYEAGLTNEEPACEPFAADEEVAAFWEGMQAASEQLAALEGEQS